jgi:hypothetical protein
MYIKVLYATLSVICLTTVNSCVVGTHTRDTAVFYEDPDTPRGPGLFSGEKGNFVLYSQELVKSEKSDEQKATECQ